MYNRAQVSTTEPLQRATPFKHFFRLEGKKISVAAVATPRVTRFADFYFSKFGQRGLQSGPNPATQIFTGGVLKPFDIVEKVLLQTE